MKNHLEIISIEAMIGHLTERRGYLFDEIKPELNALNVTTNNTVSLVRKLTEMVGMVNKFHC